MVPRRTNLQYLLVDTGCLQHNLWSSFFLFSWASTASSTCFSFGNPSSRQVRSCSQIAKWNWSWINSWGTFFDRDHHIRSCFGYHLLRSFSWSSPFCFVGFYSLYFWRSNELSFLTSLSSKHATRDVPIDEHQVLAVLHRPWLSLQSLARKERREGPGLLLCGYGG